VNQAQSAKDLVACLAELGIEAETITGGAEGVATPITSVMIGGTDDSVEWNIPGVMGAYDRDKYGNDLDSPLLVSNGTDLTSEFESCISSTGFFVPPPQFDPSEEAATKQAMADASNEWARCARDNGLPNIVDAGVTVDNWETKPSVLVPNSVDVEVFREVLNHCPALDPDRDLTQGNLTEGGSAPAYVDPQITFEPSADGEAVSPLERVLVDHVRALSEAARH
jgi:hypothetical protein